MEDFSISPEALAAASGIQHAAHATPDTPAAVAAERRLLQNLEDHLDEFPLYASSSAYRANHAPAYENKRDAAGFFFS